MVSSRVSRHHLAQLKHDDADKHKEINGCHDADGDEESLLSGVFRAVTGGRTRCRCHCTLLTIGSFGALEHHLPSAPAVQPGLADDRLQGTHGGDSDIKVALEGPEPCFLTLVECRQYCGRELIVLLAPIGLESTTIFQSNSGRYIHKNPSSQPFVSHYNTFCI